MKMSQEQGNQNQNQMGGAAAQPEHGMGSENPAHQAQGAMPPAYTQQQPPGHHQHGCGHMGGHYQEQNMGQIPDCHQQNPAHQAQGAVPPAYMQQQPPGHHQHGHMGGGHYQNMGQRADWHQQAQPQAGYMGGGHYQDMGQRADWHQQAQPQPYYAPMPNNQQQAQPQGQYYDPSHYPMRAPYYPPQQTQSVDSGLSSFFNFRDERFLKGALVGAAATFLLTNDSVQKNAINSIVKVWSLFQGGLEEVKERFRDAEAEIKAEDSHK
jgi:hypothetical protein